MAIFSENNVFQIISISNLPDCKIYLFSNVISFAFLYVKHFHCNSFMYLISSLEAWLMTYVIKKFVLSLEQICYVTDILRLLFFLEGGGRDSDNLTFKTKMSMKKNLIISTNSWITEKISLEEHDFKKCDQIKIVSFSKIFFP